MSLKLHPDCRLRLAETLSSALATIRVVNGRFLDYKSTSALSEIDSVLPNGELRTRLTSYISEAPFSDFVCGALEFGLANTQEYNAQADPTALLEKPGFHDIAALCTRLIDDFDSLPWPYALSLPLPVSISSFLAGHIKEFTFSPSIRIVTPDSALTAEYPPPNDLGMIFGRAPNLIEMEAGLSNPAWPVNGFYLQVHMNGFVPLFGKTTLLDDGIDYVKTFFGLGLAMSLFRPERKLEEALVSEPLLVHQKTNDKWEYKRQHRLDSSVSRLIYSLEMHDTLAELSAHGDRQLLLEHAFGLMRKALSAEPSSRRLLLAAQWLFDSYSGSDEMLSFVQAAVVLEILLGDKASSDAVGLGELLRNRCAYFISRDHAEREQILRDFPRIYAVRSKIVHEGKKRLNLSEWNLFAELRRICQRVIRAEVRLLTQNSSEMG